MGKRAVGIIFSSLNDNTLSRLTADRTVSAIPFACRYRLIDFALSNMVNANISNISIIANYNYRSLIEHIGSGKDWDLARRGGGINVISPYQTASHSTLKLFSTHMEALINMKEYIDEFKEELVVLMDSDQVLNVDLSVIINEHLKSDAKITIVTYKPNRDYISKKPRMMLNTFENNIKSITISNTYTETHPEVSLNIFIMSTTYLRRLIDEAVLYNLSSLTSIILNNYYKNKYRIYRVDSYVASVTSFGDYYKCSMELLANSGAREALLHNRTLPVYTRVNNSSPVVYKEGAEVVNSMIADDCTVEGKIINSIIFRNVRIEKGAEVRNSVLFSGTRICSSAKINCIVTDKDVTVSECVCLSGHSGMPFYIKKGMKV